MPRVRFHSDFPWHPHPATTILYVAGNEYPVTEACAKEAVDKGKGEIVSAGGNADAAEPASRKRKARGDADG
jgi:hypothetical protein